MANLQVIAIDGLTTVYLWAEGTGTNLDPYKSNFNAYQGGNWSVAVNNFPETQPVSIASLPPLPSGTNMIGGITNTGFNVNNFPVSYPSTQSGTWSVGVNNFPSSFNVGNFPATQQISGSVSVSNFPISYSVTGTFWQDTQPVSLVSIPLANNAATATKQEDIKTLTGTLTETAPSTDTASSGLNGRLQRIAQRLTSLISLFPSTLGAKTAANSFPVTLASDGVASGISTQIGEVQTSPTANTILDRLKTINTTLGGLSVGGSSAGTSYISDVIVTTRGANTTAYIAGDVYGTLFEITNFAEANKGFWLLNVNLVSSLSSLPTGMGSFKLFLFDSQPSTIADNGVFPLATTSITPQGIWLNNLSVITNATGATSQTDEINVMRIRGSGNLWGYIVTQSAFTPAASTADTLTMRFRGVSI